MTPETPNQIVDSDFRTDEYSSARKDRRMTTRRRILVGFGLVLPAVVFLVTSGEQSGGVTTNPVTLNFGEVVQRILLKRQSTKALWEGRRATLLGRRRREQ